MQTAKGKMKDSRRNRRYEGPCLSFILPFLFCIFYFALFSPENPAPLPTGARGGRDQGHTPPAPEPGAPAVPSDYTKRVVAYLGDEYITRADLGEYLIPRCGPEKVDVLIKRRVLEGACRARGITVTAAEVDASLAEQMRGLN